jgi:hypothetical protein
MPLARLRRLLQSQLVVDVDSSQGLLAAVAAEVAARTQDLINKNKPVPPFKAATTIAAHDGLQWRVRPVALLHKIGRMTTPSGLGNMAKLSASWATRRYFWTIAEPIPNNQKLRLSVDALGLDFHQKGLLSDEFGIGMAGLFMEQNLGAAESMDISLALRDELMAQQIEASGRTQPDYLMWNSQPHPTYFVIECKGTQSGRSESMNQIRRGLEQVPSIEFVDPARHGGSFVIATCLSATGTTLFLIDPPNGEDEKSKRQFKGDEVSERAGERRWKITNVEAFERRNRIAKAAQILQWAGQNRQALDAAEQLEPFQRTVEPPDVPMVTREIAGLEFRGQRVNLFPELSADLHVFLGVEEELLSAAEEDGEVPLDTAHIVADRSVGIRERTEPTTSVSADGTCMQIEGLPPLRQEI